MEKIRQALDRARAERAELELVAPQATPVGRAAPQPAAGAPRPAAADAAAAAANAAPRAGSPQSAAPVAARARDFELAARALADNRLVVGERGTPAARAFRMLRTQVLQRMREHRWRTLGVVSARSGDGKTTTALNLALAIAASGAESVLLADLDLVRPGVAAKLGLEPERGVEDVLAGRCAVDECLYRPRSIERFVILPARGADGGGPDVIGAAASLRLVDELRARYPDRIVLFDLPPVLETDAAAALAPSIDCFLFVVAEGGTARHDVVRALETLHRAPVVGTVLNRSLEPVDSKAYG